LHIFHIAQPQQNNLSFHLVHKILLVNQIHQQGFALYFSRSVIPFPREENVGVRYMKHIGIYAFRKEALMDFYRLPMLSLEASEKLEQLRYLEYGKRIKMVETTHGSIGIDTPEDLEKARILLNN
jgi:3-deoxy-manno-octulosonate cytidylyltransferase (CMP-KDO synthetase)